MKTIYPNPLRKYRKAAGLRQHEVSIALGLGGSTERISKWENGHAIPKSMSLFRLAALYHVSAQELFNEMMNPPIEERCSCGVSMSEARDHLHMVPADETKPSPFLKKPRVSPIIVVDDPLSGMVGYS